MLELLGRVQGQPDVGRNSYGQGLNVSAFSNVVLGSAAAGGASGTRSRGLVPAGGGAPSASDASVGAPGSLAGGLQTRAQLVGYKAGIIVGAVAGSALLAGAAAAYIATRGAAAAGRGGDAAAAGGGLEAEAAPCLAAAPASGELRGNAAVGDDAGASVWSCSR
jgi:hypothetical protein